MVSRDCKHAGHLIPKRRATSSRPCTRAVPFSFHSTRPSACSLTSTTYKTAHIFYKKRDAKRCPLILRIPQNIQFGLDPPSFSYSIEVVGPSAFPRKLISDVTTTRRRIEQSTPVHQLSCATLKSANQSLWSFLLAQSAVCPIE